MTAQILMQNAKSTPLLIGPASDLTVSTLLITFGKAARSSRHSISVIVGGTGPNPLVRKHEDRRPNPADRPAPAVPGAESRPKWENQIPAKCSGEVRLLEFVTWRDSWAFQFQLSRERRAETLRLTRSLRERSSELLTTSVTSPTGRWRSDGRQE